MDLSNPCNRISVIIFRLRYLDQWSIILSVISKSCKVYTYSVISFWLSESITWEKNKITIKIILLLLKAAIAREIFRMLSNIYDGAFFEKIVKE